MDDQDNVVDIRTRKLRSQPGTDAGPDPTKTGTMSDYWQSVIDRNQAAKDKLLKYREVMNDQTKRDYKLKGTK